MNAAETSTKPAVAIRQLRLEGRLDEAETLALNLMCSRSPPRAVIREAAYLAYCREDWPRVRHRYQHLLDFAPSEFSAKFYSRLYQAYSAEGLRDRALSCLMESVYRFPDDPLLASQAVARNGEIGARIETWRPRLERDGPLAMKVQAELFQRTFLRGDAINAHRFKDMCAEVYSNWPVEDLTYDLKYQRAAAYVHLGQYARAKEWLAHQTWGRWREGLRLAEHLSAYCDLALGDDPRRVFERVFQLENPGTPRRAAAGEPWTAWDFSDHFRDKSIAIVCPANTGQYLASEIDGFDIVVRMNLYDTKTLEPTAERLGTRVDVSYYTNMIFQERAQELYKLVRETGLIPVLRRGHNVAMAREQGGLVRVRGTTPSPRNFLPNYASMHALQRTMWDLRKFSPARIKVFNANFYAGEMYDAGYAPANIPSDLTAVGVPHDPLRSFIFTKIMHASGAVEFDPVASDYLAWSRDQYIAMLQHDYADQWRT